jgi:hypothetical protein
MNNSDYTARKSSNYKEDFSLIQSKAEEVNGLLCLGRNRLRKSEWNYYLP